MRVIPLAQFCTSNAAPQLNGIFVFSRIMKVNIVIYEDNIKAAVVELIRRGVKPTLKNTKALIAEMITANGEVWTTEPNFEEDLYPEKVDVYTAIEQAKKIAPKFYDKIF